MLFLGINDTYPLLSICANGFEIIENRIFSHFWISDDRRLWHLPDYDENRFHLHLFQLYLRPFELFPYGTMPRKYCHSLFHARRRILDAVKICTMRGNNCFMKCI